MRMGDISPRHECQEGVHWAGSAPLVDPIPVGLSPRFMPHLSPWQDRLTPPTAGIAAEGREDRPDVSESGCASFTPPPHLFPPPLRVPGSR